ncbi:Intraflagellar transport protein 80 [Tritrichomonas musculus]|uniref:Intraflagellar transport protein 80 n=1 Tax=Tritrichomonas musculus TaxID=1915356 RepID=A0ABR2H7Q3_9EUKA
MKLQVLSKTDASSLQGVDGMVAAACFDEKHFFSAVDGGAIRKYPFQLDDINQTTDDSFVLKQSHITCIDSTCEVGAPNTFFIGCSDGNFHLCSTNWRVEKTVQGHNGGITSLAVNPDGTSIATAGEDGLVKIWSRNGSLRSALASCGTTVTTLHWDCTGKYIMFTHGGNVTIRSASFKQEQTQFRAHRRLIMCTDWDSASNTIITGGEDRYARIFDADGRSLAESMPFDFAVSSVSFVSNTKLCIVGTANRVYLTDNKLSILNTLSLPAGSFIVASPTMPRVFVGGNGVLALIAVTGKKIVYKDCEVVSESPRKLTIFDLKNGITENLQFSESITNFYMNFGNLIVTTPSKVQIYKCGQWTTPVIVDTKESVRVIAQSQTMFAMITISGAQIIGYDGRPISRINDSRVKWDLLSSETVAVSPSIFVAIMPDGRRHVFAFSTSTGQMITSEPLQHSSEIRCVKTNQATSQARARFGFVNSNGDLTICRFVASNPRLPPSIETSKLANFVDEFEWHSTHDLIISRSAEKLAIYCCPSAAFFTAELMPMLRIELRLLFDAAGISAFDGSHAFIIAKDGANCVVPISPFLVMIHEAVEVHRNWKSVLQICRQSQQSEQYLWAVCAACAIQAGEVEAAQEAYAALSLVDRVMFLGKVKKMKSPASRNAMIAVLQGRVNEAEDILIQGGCIFRAVKMNISLGRWDKALAIAKRTNKFVEVVAAYRTEFLKELDMEETDQNFAKIGPVSMESVKSIIQQEKQQEMSG